MNRRNHFLTDQERAKEKQSQLNTKDTRYQPLIYSQMKPYPKKEAFPKDQNPHY
jgi:hypothetical protein